MQLIDKHSGKGYLNSDDADHIIQPDEYVNLSDFRYGTADGVLSRVGYWESVGGTTIIPNLGLPATGTNICIGHATNYPSKRIVYFNWNSFGAHGIYCYDANLGQVFTVLLNSQLTGGLNFDKNQLIHSAYVLNGCVYWVNGQQNEPRRLNINAGIKLNQPTFVTNTKPYSAPLDISIISWIRRQPGLPPVALKVNQISPALPTNFIALEAFLFCYRYIYRDFETGTLSALSNLCNYNLDADLYNRIDITIPLQETIQQDVVQVDLVAQYVTSGVYFIINSWQTANPTDAAAIAAHNAGTPLSFSFYNDKVGATLSSSYSVKPFDSVPIFANGCEEAKSRSFMSNYIAGYTAPFITSLTATPNTQSSTDTQVTGSWSLFQFQSVCGSSTSSMTIYMIDVSNIPDNNNPGYYVHVPDAFPPFPTSVAYQQLQFRGQGLFDVMNSYSPGCHNSILQFVQQGVSSIVTGAPSPPQLIGKTCLKSDDSYQLSVSFLDYYGRKCGIVTQAAARVSIPDRSYSTVSFTTSIQWLLSNLNAAGEIPAFAYYYSINVTKSLRTRFFQQARSRNVIYVTKDNTNQNTYTQTAYLSTNAGIAIDISSLANFAQGYVFNQGDIIKLYFINGTSFKLSITDQQGVWLIAQLANVGTLALNAPVLFEIYTPYHQQSNEPYFETGQIFQVSNPTTSLRSYSIITGQIPADVTLLNRNDGVNDYLAESMSPNDKFYRQWNTAAGRPNIIDTIGQVSRPSTLAYSNTFINGAQVNGLSTFDALDTYDISADYGAIAKIILTNKIQKTGSIMLAICTGGETSSLYLGENVIMSTTGETSITQASTVISYSNNLKGSFGTINPESVFEYRGNVYWFDALNAEIVQYSDSGLFPISTYKMSRFWNVFSDQWNSMTQAQIEALGDRPFVFIGVDPHNNELIVSIPTLLAAPPLGYFNDYTPPIPYPYDIYDGQGKAIVYKTSVSPNRWQGSYSFKAEGSAYLNEDLFTWNGGNIYVHNTHGNYCNYYGIQHQPSISVISNKDPRQPKVFETLSVEGNTIPIEAIMRCFYPFQQGSDLLASDFKNLEGIFYAPILRDRLTPSFNNNYFAALYGGDPMRNTALYIYLVFDPTQGIVQIKSVNTNYNISVGANHVV